MSFPVDFMMNINLCEGHWTLNLKVETVPPTHDQRSSTPWNPSQKMHQSHGGEVNLTIHVCHASSRISNIILILHL